MSTTSPDISNSLDDQQFRRLLTAVLIFGLCAGIMAAFQLSAKSLPGLQGYYHIRMAQQMRIHNLMPEFIWLPLTTWNPKDYYEHYFLYQLYLMLFIPSPAAEANPQDLIAAAKFAVILLGAAVGTATWWLLESQKVRGAPVWTLSLFVLSTTFLYRLNIPRSYVMFLLWLLLALNILLSQRYRWLILLGFIAVWTYDGFPLLPVMIGAYVAAVWLAERQCRWQPLAWGAAGTALGLLLTPYFPRNMAAILSHINSVTGVMPVKISEWSRPTPVFLVRDSGPTLALLLLGLAGLFMPRRKLSPVEWTTLFMSLLSGAMTLYAVRFLEYFPAFTLIFAAVSLNPILKQLHSLASWQRLAASGAASLLMAISGWLTIPVGYQLVTNALPVGIYEGAAHWLAQNTPPGSLIYNTDIDSFYGLFFYNPHNAYVSGLSPELLARQNPKLADLFKRISLGELAQPGRFIGEEFGTSYIVVPTGLVHTDVFTQDSNLDQVYEDSGVMIFFVLPEE